MAKYKALLAGLRLAKECSVRHLTVYSDSELVVSASVDLVSTLVVKNGK